MSKPIKEMIRKQLEARFDGVSSIAICGFVGVDAAQTYTLRSVLAEQGIAFRVVKNSLARQAFKAVGLDAACELLDGPCAVAYGSDSVVSVVRTLLDVQKDTAPTLEIKAAVLDGDIFAGKGEIDALSKFPTREEAIGQVVQTALSAGSNLAGCIVAPGGAIAGILKTIEEKEETTEEDDAA